MSWGSRAACQREGKEGKGSRELIDVAQQFWASFFQCSRPRIASYTPNTSTTDTRTATMAYSRLFTPRNLAFFSMFSLGGGYLTMKSRALAVKQRERGDYSVTVDRSGGGI
ncbi:hypothetical protein DPSP01_004493 [Paraphaeosphaeria sporulosa]